MAINETLKEASQLGIIVREALGEIRQMYVEDNMPNTVRLSEDQCQFNIQLGEQGQHLIMNFNIYLTGINNYLLNLVSLFPQSDFLYPENSDESTMLFKIRGAPFLGVHNLDKPIMALSLDEAVEAGLEYVYDNIENIILEAMGASGLK